MVISVVKVAVVIRKNLFISMFGGCICGVGSGVNSGCGGSSVAYHHHHYHYNYNHHNHHRHKKFHNQLHQTAYT